MLFFEESRGKPGRKTSQSRIENQQQTLLKGCRMVPFDLKVLAKFGLCSNCSQKLDECSLARARKIFAATRMLGFSLKIQSWRNWAPLGKMGGGGGKQGGKSPFSLLSEPISPSSLLLWANFSLLPKRLRFFFSLLPTFSPYFSLLPTFFGPFLPTPYSVPPPSKMHALWMHWKHASLSCWRFIETDALNDSSRKPTAKVESDLETWRHVEHYYNYSTLRGCQSCMASIG